MGTFLSLCLQTVCLVQKNVSAFHRELNHCDQRASALSVHNEMPSCVWISIPEAVLQV